MTKRFRKIDNVHIREQSSKNGKPYTITYTISAIVDRLNGLYKENEQLKQREETLLNEIEDFQEILTKLDKENEQLRKENQRLDDLWGEKCIREYLTVCGENILKEMHDEKYGDDLE